MLITIDASISVTTKPNDRGFKKDAMTFPTRLVRLGQGDKSRGVVFRSLEFHGFWVEAGCKQVGFFFVYTLVQHFNGFDVLMSKSYCLT